MIASACTAGPVFANGDGYEVWGADQSNSVSGVASGVVNVSYMWFWDSKVVEMQL